MEQMHLLVNLDLAGYKLSILSHFGVTFLIKHTRIIIV
jgi:hypothetical protein